MYFKLYGQRRTGTNFLRFILLKNFNDITIFSNVGGWKHGLINTDYNSDKNILQSCDNTTIAKWKPKRGILKRLFKEQRVKILITIKNPYAWILSVHNFDRKKITLKSTQYYINKWNLVYHNYLDYIKNNQAYLVRYEDVINNIPQFLQSFQKNFGLTKNNEGCESYIWTDKLLMPNDDDNPYKVSVKSIFDISYYQNKTYVEDPRLSKEIINLINKSILPETFTFYGYKKL